MNTDRAQYHRLLAPDKKPSEAKIRQLLEDPYGAVRGRSRKNRPTPSRRAAKRGWKDVRTDELFIEFLEYTCALADRDLAAAKVAASVAVRLAFWRLSRSSGWCFTVRALCALASIMTRQRRHRKAAKIIGLAEKKAGDCPHCTGEVLIEKARHIESRALAEKQPELHSAAYETAACARRLFSDLEEKWQEGKAALFEALTLFDSKEVGAGIEAARDALRLLPADSRHFNAALLNYVRMLAEQRRILEAQELLPFLTDKVGKIDGLHCHKEWLRWLEALVIVNDKNEAQARIRARRKLETARANFAQLGMGLEVMTITADIAFLIYPDRNGIEKLVKETMAIEGIQIEIDANKLSAKVDKLIAACEKKIISMSLPKESFQGKCNLLAAGDWDPTGEVGTALLAFRKDLGQPPLSLGPNVRPYRKNHEYVPRKIQFRGSGTQVSHRASPGSTPH